MTTIKDILNYCGNKNYFSCFCQDEDDKYFVLFAQTDGIYIEGEQEEDFGLEFKKYINSVKHKITLPISKHYYIIPVNDFKDFKLINKILEVVWMDD